MIDNDFWGRHPCLNNVKDEISRRISDSFRFEHTLAVNDECLLLADIFGLSDKEKTQLSLAALLHDVAKGLSIDEFRALDEKYRIGFTDDDFASPAVLHAKAGAKIAEYEFSEYTDRDICKAIREHTTGDENMSLISKLLFISDYIEETRTHSSCIEARNYFYQNINTADDKISVLNKTIIMSIDATLRFLIDRGSTIDIETINARNSVLRELAN